MPEIIWASEVQHHPYLDRPYHHTNPNPNPNPNRNPQRKLLGYCLHTAADGVVLFSASTAGNVSAFRRAIREYMRQTWLVCVNLMACGSVPFIKNGGKNNCGHSMWRMTAPLCKVSVINGTTNVLGRQQTWSGTRGTNIP